MPRALPSQTPEQSPVLHESSWRRARRRAERIIGSRRSRPHCKGEVESPAEETAEAGQARRLSPEAGEQLTRMVKKYERDLLRLGKRIAASHSDDVVSAKHLVRAHEGMRDTVSPGRRYVGWLAGLFAGVILSTLFPVIIAAKSFSPQTAIAMFVGLIISVIRGARYND